MTAIPTVHLNGTGRVSLLRELREARDTLAMARTAMANMTVHMRDFYVQPEGSAAFERYRDEHIYRLRRLEAIAQELEALTLAIDAQE